MPIFLLYQPQAQKIERVSSGVIAMVTVDRAVSALLATVVTQTPRAVSGLFARVATFDPASVPFPPTGSGGGYVVTHSGLPEEAVSYSISLSSENSLKAPLPKLDVVLRGRVALSGEIHITVSVQPGGRQTYGPFGVLGYSYQQTPTGWITKVNTVDASETDAEDDSPLMPFFAEEFLPWEQERDLTPLEQALRARADALAQRQIAERQASAERILQERLARPNITPTERAAIRRQIKNLKKQTKKKPDRRRVPVQDVLQYALSRLPMPFELKGTPPYAGDFFWADEDTGLPFLGGKLIGVSYQLKGKTPRAVLEELLSPVGWQFIIRFGVLYIGPAEELKNADETPGELELPGDMLTGLSIEAVNPEAASGNGNRALPRELRLAGASARLYLPPLPPEKDEDDNVTDPSEFGDVKNGTFRTESYTYALNPDTGKDGVQSHTVSTLTKADGVLIEETTRTEGLVPTFVLNRDQLGNYTATTLKMALQEDRRTTHGYGALDYPRALTWTRTGVRAYLDWLGKDMPSEISDVRQEWHAEGWLLRKISSKGTYDYYTELIYQIHHEDETETWTPINEQTWHHEIRRFKSAWQIYTDEQGEPDEVRRAGVTEYWSETTDQGPPRAPQEDDKPEREDEDEDIPEESEGFPYENTLVLVLFPGGRGDPASRSAPWATSLSASWLTDIIGAIRRARTGQRTRYEFAAPPSVKLGTRVKEMSLTGSGGSVKGTITVEEVLDVL